MRYSAEHKRETRARILQAAGQVFRKEGYGGSGIDGLTKAAGVTNGAFYGHFRSKSEAFRETVLTGLEELRLAIVELKAGKGQGWLSAFASYYLGTKRVCDLGQSCALPSLSPEVMRADDETRQAYQLELQRLIAEVSAGLPDEPGEKNTDRAIALLALLSGGVTLARAVSDPALSERIAAAVSRQAHAIAPAPKD